MSIQSLAGGDITLNSLVVSNNREYYDGTDTSGFDSALTIIPYYNISTQKGEVVMDGAIFTILGHPLTIVAPNIDGGGFTGVFDLIGNNRGGLVRFLQNPASTYLFYAPEFRKPFPPVPPDTGFAGEYKMNLGSSIIFKANIDDLSQGIETNIIDDMSCNLYISGDSTSPLFVPKNLIPMGYYMCNLTIIYTSADLSITDGGWVISNGDADPPVKPNDFADILQSTYTNNSSISVNATFPVQITRNYSPLSLKYNLTFEARLGASVQLLFTRIG